MHRRYFILVALFALAEVLVPSNYVRASIVASSDALPAASGGPAAGSQACQAAAPKCCEKPCIDYRYKHPCRKVCCGCEPPRKLTLQVKDPCCCDSCPVEVPVCVPACCDGNPCVSTHCGLFGRGVVCYEWCCGYRLTVTFKKCGDVLVTYFGS